MNQRLKVTIPFSSPATDGETINLAAALDLPDEPRAFAIFAHCFTCTKDAVAAKRISRDLAKAGLAVMRLDFMGLGESEGDHGNNTVDNDARALVTASEWLEENYQAPTLLIGHSMGGVAAVMASHDMPALRALVTLATPYDLTSLLEHLDGDLPQVDSASDSSSVTEMSIGGNTIRIGSQFIEQLDESYRDYLRDLRVPLLVIHSKMDSVVDIHQAQKLYQDASTTKSFFMLENTHHLVKDAASAHTIARIIDAWSQQYLD